MVEGRYADAYPLYDPFFRAKNSLETFEGAVGRIDYLEYEVTSVEVDEPIATVNVRVKASVPPFKVERTGEMVSQPERELTIPSSWLLIDGEWYREFRLESQNLTYTNY